MFPHSSTPPTKRQYVRAFMNLKENMQTYNWMTSRGIQEIYRQHFSFVNFFFESVPASVFVQVRILNNESTTISAAAATQ